MAGWEILALIAALRALIACSTMLRNGLYLPPGLLALRCAGDPSYMSLTRSSGFRFCLVCAKKSLKRRTFIPPIVMDESIQRDTAVAIVTWLLAVQMLERLHSHSDQESVSAITRIWITCGLFLSAGNGLASSTHTSIPSRAFPIVLSCTKGFPGNLRRSSWFISFKVSRPFSLSFKHLFLHPLYRCYDHHVPFHVFVLPGLILL